MDKLENAEDNFIGMFYVCLDFGLGDFLRGGSKFQGGKQRATLHQLRFINQKSL